VLLKQPLPSLFSPPQAQTCSLRLRAHQKSSGFLGSLYLVINANFQIISNFAACASNKRCLRVKAQNKVVLLYRFSAYYSANIMN
jgi:hypothetical protein